MKCWIFRGLGGAAISMILGAAAPEASAQAVTVTYEYDVHGRLTEVSDTVRGVSTYNFDDAGNLQSVVTSGNQPPVAQDKYYTADAHEKWTIHAWYVATDPNGDTLTYTYVSSGTLSNANQTLTVYSPTAHGTSLVINFTVSDGHGHTDDGTITLYTE